MGMFCMVACTNTGKLRVESLPEQNDALARSHQDTLTTQSPVFLKETPLRDHCQVLPVSDYLSHTTIFFLSIETVLLPASIPPCRRALLSTNTKCPSRNWSDSHESPFESP